MRRLFPHPYLSVFLALVWMLLVGKLTTGNLILGTFLGIFIPITTRVYWPDAPTMVRPGKFVVYVLVVIWDILVANFVVAAKVLFRSNASLSPCWVSIPLDLTRPEAITILAGTITLTPGTVTADMSAHGRALLVHCLDAPDPDAVREEIKTRYEARLLEIFP